MAGLQLFKVKTNSEVENPSADLLFMYQGSEDPGTVETYVQSQLLPNYYDLFLTNWNKEHLGAGYWIINVRYASNEPKQPGTQSWTFDTTGGSAKIYHSLHTDAHAPSGKTPPDHHGLIGDQGDKKGADGCEIVVPKFQFAKTLYMEQEEIPSEYIQNLYLLTGTINSEDFIVTIMGQEINFLPSECLFLGATGSQKGFETCEFTLKFAGEASQDGLEVGDIVSFDKPGWSYLWIQEGRTDDTGSHTTVNQPIAAYVEQVYPEADFDIFGIL